MQHEPYLAKNHCNNLHHGCLCCFKILLSNCHMIDCDVKDTINISKGHVSKVACCQKANMSSQIPLSPPSHTSYEFLINFILNNMPCIIDSFPRPCMHHII